MTVPPTTRIAVLGMIDGNGHPWSWSAIINGYNAEAMEQCPYPVIRDYLDRQPTGSVGIDGAQVTHIWTDNPADAEPIAAAALIPHVVSHPRDVIGKVDAVIIATDDGNDHVRRAAPFIEAGLPIFIDKPMAINMNDLRQFVSWHKAGRQILSTSGLRYAPEMRDAATMAADSLRWVTSFTCKSWERYGIHALEAVYPVLGPGFESVQAISRPGSDLMHIAHRSGCMVTVAAIEDAPGSFGAVHLYSTHGEISIRLRDTYAAFRAQLVAYLDFLRTSQPPFPFDQTVELMLILIAGIRSREAGGTRVNLDDLRRELEN